MRPTPSQFLIVLVPLALGACAGKEGKFSTSAAGVGVNVVRSPCPAVGIPAYTGDITVFDPANSRAASAIDVVATMTNVRTSCDGSAENQSAEVVSSSTFDVEARRTSPAGARDVTFPYFSTVLRGGNVVTAKRVGQVTVHFADGQLRATGNYRRISTEIWPFTRAAPTTPMGRAEASWLAAHHL